MTEPIVWEKYDDFQLMDIHEENFEKVKQFAIKHFIESNLICTMMKYTHEENYGPDHDFFLDHLFKDGSSLVMVKEETEDIVAAVLMKTMTKEMRAWTAIRLVSKSRSLNALLAITRLMLADAPDVSGNPVGQMHIFEICIPKDSQIDWSSQLFHGAYRVAQSMRMPLLTYVGFTLAEQAAAEAWKFKEVGRLFYPTYSEIDGFRPIPPSDIGESYAVLYCKEVEPFIPHDQMP